MCEYEHKVELQKVEGEELKQFVVALQKEAHLNRSMAKEGDLRARVMRFETEKIVPGVDPSLDDYSVGILRLLVNLGVQPVTFTLKDEKKSKRCYDMTLQEVYGIDEEYHVFQKGGYFVYPLL